MSSASNSESFQSEFGGDNIRFEYLDDYKINRLELFRQSFYLSTLVFKSNTIRLYAENDKTSALRFLSSVSNFLSKIFGRFRLQRLLGSLMRVSNLKRDYSQIFERHKPDLAVVTRVLRGSPDYPILKEAAVRKLPVIALVSSWDNFTTKGFFPFGVKKLVVWNDVMKQEAAELFGIPEEDISMAGIPRFDNYFNKKGMSSRNEFFKAFDLDLKKKLITYTTGNKALCLPPGETISAEVDIARRLALAINDGELGAAQLIVRLHPLAEFSDFEALEGMENVTFQVPGKSDAFKDRLFTKQDNLVLAETVLYSDVVLNFASTMTIDAAVFDTPSLSVAFDVRGPLPMKHSVKKFYEYEHYRKLRKTGGVHLVHSAEEMVEQTRRHLLNPTINAVKRSAIVDQQCKFTDGKSGERVATEILNYLDSL